MCGLFSRAKDEALRFDAGLTSMPVTEGDPDESARSSSISR